MNLFDPIDLASTILRTIDASGAEAMHVAVRMNPRHVDALKLALQLDAKSGECIVEQRETPGIWPTIIGLRIYEDASVPFGAVVPMTAEQRDRWLGLHPWGWLETAHLPHT